MNKPTVKNVKARIKHYAPAIATGGAIGVAVTAVVFHRMYNPTDKIAIQLPAGAYNGLVNERKTAAINSNGDWFTLSYVPND